MTDALLVVAHPDDEVLWFGGTLRLHQDLAWTVASVTYDVDTPRGQDFLAVSAEMRVQGMLLGLEDTYGGLLDEVQLEAALRRLLKQRPWRVVLTHNVQGEYGHPHHRQVSRIVRQIWGKVAQSGFGAENINGIVWLSPEVVAWKKRLFDFYPSAGKRDRIKLYPPYQMDYEPLVLGNETPLKAVRRLAQPTTWKALAGLRRLAHRRTQRLYRIALLADTEGWAHHIIAAQLARSLPPEFEVSVLYLFDSDYRQRLPVSLNPDEYDVIHLMSWRHWDVIRFLGLPRRKLVTTVHGHRDLDGVREVSQHFAAISTVSARLFADLRARLPALALTPCGVDTQVFYPEACAPDTPFTFGAVGRCYAEPPERDDIKGWRQILEPLAQELQPLRAHYLQVDRSAKVPHGAMPDFYRACHCYVCCSRSEGNPLPLLEAASCGLPVLSTDVGVAPEIIEEGRNGRIVPRTKAAFAEAIRELSGDRAGCLEMGRRGRQKMLASRDWSITAGKWAEFYQAVL